NRNQGGSNGDASGSTAPFTFAGTAVGGAVGSGVFFTTATPTLVIIGSTLSGNQSIPGTSGRVSSYYGTDPGNGRGGAIGIIAGNASVSGSTISGNLAESGALQTYLGQYGSIIPRALGGGLDDEQFGSPPFATLTVTNSTISGNVAQNISSPDAFGYGGGLDTQVSTQVINSTVSGNQAIGGPGGRGVIAGNGGKAAGGGIYSTGSITISGSTVRDNVAQGGPGGGPTGSGFGGPSDGGRLHFGGFFFTPANSPLTGDQSLGRGPHGGGRS